MAHEKATSLRLTTGARLVSNGRPASLLNVVIVGGSGNSTINPSLFDGDHLIVQLNGTAANTVGSGAGNAIPNPHADDEGRRLTFVATSAFVHTVTFASAILPSAATIGTMTAGTIGINFTVVAKSSRWHLLGGSGVAFT